jgi:hypothetical protein
MQLRFSHAVIIASAFVVSACANGAHLSLPAASHSQIGSTETVLPIQQSEIYVYVPPTNGGGGILGALIEAGIADIRTTKAEKAVAPLRNALVDFNFDDTFKSALKDALIREAWLGAADYRVIKDVTIPSMDAALMASKAGAVLFTWADYQLSNDGDVLTISVGASVFPNKDALKVFVPKPPSDPARQPKTAPENSIYHNSFRFVTRIPPSPEGRDGNIAVWSAGNGAIMRDALKLGTARIAQMLADDLRRTAEEGDVAAKAGAEIKVAGFRGNILANDAEGDIVRFADGSLAYGTKAVLEQP